MLSEQAIVKALGGRSSLGKPVNSPFELDELIRAGFPNKAGIYLKNLLDLSTNQFTKYLHLSERTWIRVRNSNQRLSAVVSDRIYRLARIYALACEVMEDDTIAKEWLSRPQFGLGEKIPLDLLQTEAGTKEVEDLLWRIEYGIVA
jgi:putative toxin-antitoxin system antitoxin component (TIGR02293 family)